jgi:predicted nucleotidyltransferase component of viral defense system
MLHHNRDEFLAHLERSAAQTAFPLRLMEKDYYLTIVLNRIHMLSDDLIFKGGTCLNKIYFSYYRLSEDLDFTLKLPAENITRVSRRNTMNGIKERLKNLAEALGMNIENLDRAGHRESRQYIFLMNYHSVVLNKGESIKLEIGLRFNPVLPAEKRPITHRFIHPFTGEPLFKTGTVSCLTLIELVAEKTRAAISRLHCAPRDFYDLEYALEAGFDFRDKIFLKVLRIKLQEDGFPEDLRRYGYNLGRKNEEIEDMKSRIEHELLPVLSLKERKSFDLEKILKNFDDIFGRMST